MFSLGNIIYKFYDSNNKQLKPNIDIINAIGKNNQLYLPALTVNILKNADTSA